MGNVLPHALRDFYYQYYDFYLVLQGNRYRWLTNMYAVAHACIQRTTSNAVPLETRPSARPRLTWLWMYGPFLLLPSAAPCYRICSGGRFAVVSFQCGQNVIYKKMMEMIDGFVYV